jgi:hypothetical protein
MRGELYIAVDGKIKECDDSQIMKRKTIVREIIEFRTKEDIEYGPKRYE